MRLRATFASMDTSGAGVKLSCCEHYGNVLYEYTDGELKAVRTRSHTCSHFHSFRRQRKLGVKRLVGDNTGSYLNSGLVLSFEAASVGWCIVEETTKFFHFLHTFI